MRESPLGPARAFAVFLAFLLIQLAVGVAVGLVGVVYVITSPGATFERLQQLIVMPAAIAGTVVGGLVAFVLVCWMMPGPVGSASLAPIGWKSARRLQLLLAAVAGLGLSAFYLYGFGRFHPSGREYVGPVTALVASGALPRHLWSLLALFVAPPVEEFVFRGVLFTGFCRSWSAPWAATATVFLFALTHLTEARGAALLSIVLLGYATVVARVASGSLLPPIVLHAAYNLGMVGAVYGDAG